MKLNLLPGILALSFLAIFIYHHEGNNILEANKSRIAVAPLKTEIIESGNKNDSLNILPSEELNGEAKFTENKVNGYQSDLELIFQEGDELNKKYAVLDLIEEWARKDAMTVYAWLDEQAATEVLQALKYRVIDILIEQATQSSEVLSHLILDVEDVGSKSRLAEQYTRAVMKQDPKLALLWINNVTEPRLRNELQAAVFNHILDISPHQVLEAIEYESDVDDDLKKDFARTAASLMSSHKPSELAFSLVQYDDSIQPSIAYSVASNWSKINELEAKNWIETMSDGNTKDGAITGYINSVDATYMNSALGLAEQISDESNRSLMISRVFKMWRKKEPYEAEQALENTYSLDIEDKLALLDK
jgi:hypothetical protein